MKTRTIHLPNGVDLHYAEQGGPDGLPVLMLHGITDSWRSFEPVLPALQQQLHVFALSQRGHGDSARPHGAYRTSDFAADAALFIEAMDRGPMRVVGHSMGSANALQLAIERPDLVRGLVLVSAFASFSDKPELVAFNEQTIQTLRDPVDPAVVRDFQNSTLAVPIPADFLEMVVQESLKLPARVWHAAFAGLMEDSFVAGLQRVSAPGHALHWEQPQRFAGDLVAFAQRLV